MVDLVDQYRDKVFGLCFRMLGHRQDAEDAAQETLIRMLRSLSRWDPKRDFDPWLLAIAGNRCRTALATRQRRPATALLEDGMAADASPDLQAAKALAEEVNRALGKIRPEYREAFVLFHEQEFSYEQIAGTMERPLGTIKTWIRRARAELVKELQARGVVTERRHEMR